MGNPVWSAPDITLSINLTTSGAQQIKLYAGWNLISFQINNCYFETEPTVFIPDNTQRIGVSSMLEWFSDDIASPVRDDADPNRAGDWQRIISFDQDGAQILDKDLPPQINTLKYISAGYGYWIKMTDDYQMTFAVYDVETDGNALWTEQHDQEPVTVENGIYNVHLGAIEPFLPRGTV